jgi:hypothetical protein
MKPYKSLLFPVVLAITLISCGKDEMAKPDVEPEWPVNKPPEPGNSASKIEGTWTFVGLRLTATSTATVANERAVTYTDYTTFNNAGTTVIAANKMTLTGFTYAIDAVSKTKYYLDGVLDDEWEVPVKVVLSPYNGTSTYKQINADSIYYEAGFIQASDGSATPQQSDAIGSTISWLGDTLVITSNPYKTSTMIQNGAAVAVVSSGRSEMKMVRKK